MTNYEKIKNMSIDEMAARIVEHIEDCEQFCAYTNELGECQHTGTLLACVDGITEYLMNEAKE